MSLTYKDFGRFTNPGTYIDLITTLPNDILSLAKVVENQIVHHNLLAYYGVNFEERSNMKRLSSPLVPEMLHYLRNNDPYNLQSPRKITNRLVGSCLYESHFLSSLLKTKGYAVRQRAGYFKNIRKNQDHIVKFWNTSIRARKNNGVQSENEQEIWLKSLDEFSQHLNEIDHRIEHWIVEYFDENNDKWNLLDGNTTFLKAHSNIEVEYNLPAEYYEFSFDAWKKMRTTPNFNPDQYAEDPHDGQSHIRSFLLMDFFSLLNHEVAGRNTNFPSDTYFIKERQYSDLTSLELDELDQIADLLSKNPEPLELIELFQNLDTIKIQEITQDSYSFIYKYK